MSDTERKTGESSTKTMMLPGETRCGHRYAVLRIGEEDNGREVLFFLKYRLGLSASRIGTVKFDPEGMLLNGARVNVRAAAFTGDLLRIRTDDPPAKQRLIPYPAPLQILYEDDALLAVDKPAGTVCHPSPGHAWDTISNMVRAYYDETAPGLQVHIAGRLDRDTSGVVVFAKNSMISAALQKEQYKGDYVKEYLAVCHGRLQEKSGMITTRVDKWRDPASGLLLLKRAEEDTGAEAKTVYEVLCETPSWSLLKVTIRTGRMHQIRFHLSDLGHPLLGDPLYGDRASDLALADEERIQRTALHAYRITMKHPETGKPLVITSPVPEDMRCFQEGSVWIEEGKRSS